MKILLKTYAPLVHGAFGESAGNATLCRRMAIAALPGMPRVPVVSGNALRGIMRRSIMREMLRTAGVDRGTLDGAAWDRLYAALANGGHLDGSETRVDPTAIRELREALPPLSLFGASLYSWMLPGHMSVGILWPRCRETIEGGVVDPDGPDGSAAAEDLVEEVSHCRHVDREHQNPEVSGVTPMPTTQEAIVAGVVLESHLIFAAHATDIERSVAARAVALIESLGGKSSIGLGRVSLLDGSDTGDGGAAYLEWLRTTTDLRDRIVALAESLVATPKAKKKPKAQAEA